MLNFLTESFLLFFFHQGCLLKKIHQVLVMDAYYTWFTVSYRCSRNMTMESTCKGTLGNLKSLQIQTIHFNAFTFGKWCTINLSACFFISRAWILSAASKIYEKSNKNYAYVHFQIWRQKKHSTKNQFMQPITLYTKNTCTVPVQHFEQRHFSPSCACNRPAIYCLWIHRKREQGRGTRNPLGAWSHLHNR